MRVNSNLREIKRNRERAPTQRTSLVRLRGTQLTYVPLAGAGSEAKAFSVVTLWESELAAGVLMKVKADAVAAMDRTARASFIV